MRAQLNQNYLKVGVVTLNFLIDIGIFGFQHKDIYRKTVLRFTEYIEKMIKSRGELDTIDKLKLMRVSTYRYFSDRPESLVPGIKLSKYGLPIQLNLVKNLLKDRDVPTLKFVMTLWQLSRLIPGQKKPDLESIIKPGKDISKIRKEFNDVLPELFNRFKLESNLTPPEWSKFHHSTTMGPSGPSLLQSNSDWKLFKETYYGLLSDLNAEELSRRLVMIPDQLKDLWNKLYPPKHANVLRRITTVPDSEAKTRVIATFDFISQSILKPLHHHLMEILEVRAKVDMTFNQNIAPFGLATQKYYSFDLSSATDRFPALIQRDMLSLLFNEKYADAWLKLMTDKPFMWKNTEVKYSVGQPMGAYSSWAAFAVCHHLIVQWAALRAGKRALFTDYKLLGDDIVIRNNNVAKEYLYLMSELGVEISALKSLESNKSFEFAKRFFQNEVEITGYPVSAVAKTVGRWSELLMSTREAVRRGYPNIVGDNPQLLVQLYISLAKSKIEPFTGKDERFFKRLVRKVFSMSMFMDHFRDPSDLFRLLDLWNIPRSCNLGYDYLRSVLIECVAQIKYNALLDSLPVQVKTINRYLVKIRKELVTLNEFSPNDTPLIRALLQNVHDMQDQKEQFREWAKESISKNDTNHNFERILYESNVIPNINPENLDSSRRSVQTMKRDQVMVIKGLTLFKNTLSILRGVKPIPDDKSED